MPAFARGLSPLRGNYLPLGDFAERARSARERAQRSRRVAHEKAVLEPVPMSDDPERSRWMRWWEVGLQMQRSEVRGVGWDKACSSVRALEQRKSHGRLIEDIPAPKGFGGRWSEQREPVRQRAEDALNEGARRLQRDLNQRGVLCDKRHPCEVTISRTKVLRAARAEGVRVGQQKSAAPRVRICLPRDVSHLNRTRVCDPWGERWQRNGGMYLDAWPQVVERWSSTDWQRVRREKRHCAEFDMESLSRWWRGLREEPAFLNRTNPLLSRHLAAKLLAGQQMTNLGAYLEALPELLSAADATMRAGAKGVGRTCAFVGSGHDLRCGARRGREIDGHDAIFRANGAQQPENRGRFMPSEMLGARTDFRVNCLDNSSALPSMRSEVCIIPLSWWLQKPGSESVGNTARSCCEKLTRSSYQPSTLLPLVKRGFTFAFLNGAASFLASLPLNADPTLHGPGLADSLLFPNKPGVIVPSDSFLSNSGGNALYAALAVCDRVNVFGAGLFSEEGASGDKLYAHSYDDRVGRCATPARGLEILRMAQAAPGVNEKINGHRFAPRWLRSRIQDELLLHVMHAFDIVRWIQ